MNYARIACISLAISIVLGSIGAHAMKPNLSAESYTTWDTAVKYHVYQSLGLLVLAAAARSKDVNKRILTWAMHAQAIGLMLFCASLYLRSSASVTGWNVAWMGSVAPWGGISFIVGWLLAAYSFTRPSESTAL